MTPFGDHLRDLRKQRGLTQKQMALALNVSPAYLSALEHGKRGLPSWAFLQRIVGYLNIIWDEAETLQALAALSDPKVMIDTSALSSAATKTANLLAANIGEMEEQVLLNLQKSILDGAGQNSKDG